MINTRLASNFVTCRFKFSENIHEGESKFFRSSEDAKGSAVIEKLFALEGVGVSAVKVDANQVSVTRGSFEDWHLHAKTVAAVLTEAVDKAEDFCAADAPANMRSIEEIKKTVQDLLDSQINPAVASHGGEISLIDVKGTTVYVKLGGGCQGCGMANVTLKQGVEKALRDTLPELDEVLDVTDHAGGDNPYYAPSKK